MLGVLGLALAIWLGGRVVGAPLRVRLAAVGCLWAGVVLMQLALPAGHPLREATGGSARLWLGLAVLGAAVAAYRWWLSALRARVRPAQPERAAPFSDAELRRYSRHILLREIGGPGQRRLKDANVLVVGAGGLGSPALLYLAAAGVGRITVIDGDAVEASNLQRQIAHTDARIGQPKATSATEAMRAINPFVTVTALDRRMGEEPELVAAHDLILDGTDNFDTRYLVNRLAVATGRPLLSAAITQWEGQIGLYADRGSACYACVFPVRPADGTVPTCAEAGVAAPLPGIIGAMMAAEAVKYLTGAGETLRDRILIHDALYAETRVIRTARNPDCPVCGTAGHHAH